MFQAALIVFKESPPMLTILVSETSYTRYPL
jgi:hypothetical protein